MYWREEAISNAKTLRRADVSGAENGDEGARRRGLSGRRLATLVVATAGGLLVLAVVTKALRGLFRRRKKARSVPAETVRSARQDATRAPDGADAASPEAAAALEAAPAPEAAGPTDAAKAARARVAAPPTGTQPVFEYAQPSVSRPIGPRIAAAVAIFLLAVAGAAVLEPTSKVGSTPTTSGLTPYAATRTVLPQELTETQTQLAAHVTRAVSDAEIELSAASPQIIATPAGLALQSAVAQGIPTAGSTVGSLKALTSSAEDLSAALADFRAQQLAYENLIAQLEDASAGGTAAVAVIKVESGQPVVVWNEDEVFVAASTSKLFNAASMISAVESGERTWDSPLLGTTMGGCFDQMIVYSDNDCPNAWFMQKGVLEVESHAYKHGATNTSLRVLDLRTTAMDLARVLVGLDTSEEISDASRTRLLDAMENQIFREGIPAGLGREVVVQDKVGFLDGYLHDAALIRSPKGDYAMVVLTKNLSWTKIAELSALVYNYLPEG